MKPETHREHMVVAGKILQLFFLFSKMEIERSFRDQNSANDV